MAESIRVGDGWRRKALIEGQETLLHDLVDPDTPALQTAFEIVCRECRDLLPCGSTLAVASGRALEERAKWDHGLEREEFRLMVRCLREAGVLGQLPRVRSEKKGFLFGVPAEYGALELYDYSAHDGTLQVTRRGAMHSRVVATLGVPGGVTYDCRWEQPYGLWYRARCEAEVRALYGLGLKIAPALVYAYGPTRCRQVRRWAARRAGKAISAALVFTALTRHPRSLGRGAFDAEAVRQEMMRDLAFDQNWHARHTV